jgi:DNA-binding NarL/FixJ family response regulator
MPEPAGPVRVAVFELCRPSDAGLSGLLRDCPDFDVVGRHGELSASALDALDRERVAAILVDGRCVRRAPSETPHMAAVAPILEVVDIACPTCPMKRGGSFDGEHKSMDGEGPTPCMVARRDCASAHWNAVSERSHGDVLRAGLLKTAKRLRFVDPEIFMARDLSALTDREREVARLVCQGLSNKEIAGRLGIAVQTVKNSTRLIMTKLGGLTREQMLIRSASGALNISANG